jgi:RimJ/RimL family protein N-acetyltransferase
LTIFNFFRAGQWENQNLFGSRRFGFTGAFLALLNFPNLPQLTEARRGGTPTLPRLQHAVAIIELSRLCITNIVNWTKPTILMPHEFRTERLLLRRWRPADRESFAALNADPLVMKHFPSTLSRQESDALFEQVEAAFQQNGFGPWAVEVTNVAPFIGFVGLSVPRFKAHFTPCVEILWRLAAQYWNCGYATEAARATLRAGFDVFQLKEIVSFTVPANLASRRVMDKIGMRHDEADDFDHPSFPDGHPLKRHVLYRISGQCDSSSAPCNAGMLRRELIS